MQVLLPDGWATPIGYLSISHDRWQRSIWVHRALGGKSL